MKKYTRLNRVGVILIAAVLLMSMQQDKPAYLLYSKEGKKVKYKKMISDLATADIILFGEYHDNPISHWLQLEVTKDLHKRKKLILGAEMFEADNQDELDQFLGNDTLRLNEIDSMRLWPNYSTDYAPLVEFAKKNKLGFVATNVPRRYARLVFKGGFEALDTIGSLDKSWMAPLPINYNPELPGYKAMLEMMGGHGGENLPKAQAIKDATMAHFILKHKGDRLFIHYNGSYHSNNFEGIYWHLKQSQPDLNIKTLATVSQTNLASLLKENKGIADYIVVVAETMTSTH